MQHLQSNMINELDFCKLRGSNILREVTRTQVSALDVDTIFVYFKHWYSFRFSPRVILVRPVTDQQVHRVEVMEILVHVQVMVTLQCNRTEVLDHAVAVECRRQVI